MKSVTIFFGVADLLGFAGREERVYASYVDTSLRDLFDRVDNR